MREVGSSQNPLAMVHIIDNDANLRVPLLNCFEPIGMRATASEGAIDFLQHVDLSAPGCVLLDVKMPGMTCLEFHARLAGLGHPLPIAFMTVNASVATGVSAMKAQALDYLLKPFKSESLVNATNLALERNPNCAPGTRREF